MLVIGYLDGKMQGKACAARLWPFVAIFGLGLSSGKDSQKAEAVTDARDRNPVIETVENTKSKEREGEPGKEDLIVAPPIRHQVLLNQVAFNDGAPKRFTAPAIIDGVTFSIHKVGDEKLLFSGKVRNGIGDFSMWVAGPTPATFLLRVKGGGLDSGESFSFEAGPRRLQKMLLQPLVNCMIDGRSVVGTHPSAFSGAPWRHGSYYTHELASLATLCLAFGREIESQPRQIDWDAERARVIDPGFKIISTAGDQGILEDTRTYFRRFEGPAKDAPDVVKLIHWGLGMTLVRPEIFDADGDGVGLQVHSQSVEQIAYVLALQPRLEKWMPGRIFPEARAFVARYWQKTGLLGIPPDWHSSSYIQPDDPKMKDAWGPWMNPYKGRHAPGHSILPNLLMYEVARRDGLSHPERYLRAAVEQAHFVVRYVDWNDPRTTKGQRVSEHKTISGLVWLQRNYPEHAPPGLKASLERWADVMISRSDNMWDYRRYDTGDHWAIPVMNEPGNLGGFPACALSVSWVVDDAPKKQRLREIGFAAVDCLFGRNPINSASPQRPELGWDGMIEKGWPANGSGEGELQRLGNARGALTSAPSTAMFPYNPEGKAVVASSWIAFNTALNVGLSYIEFDEKGGVGLPEDCLKKDEE